MKRDEATVQQKRYSRQEKKRKEREEMGRDEGRRSSKKHLHVLVGEPTDGSSGGMKEHAGSNAREEAREALLGPNETKGVNHSTILEKRIGLSLKTSFGDIKRIGKGGRNDSGAASSKTIVQG